MRITKNLEKFLLFSAILLIPTQFARHFWPAFSFVFGIRIDYLAPTIYLSDILVVLILAFWISFDFKFIKSFFTKYRRLFFLMFLFMLINSFFSSNTFITATKWLKICEVFLLALYVTRRVGVVGYQVLEKAILFSLTTVSLIGVIQFYIGHTVGGYLYYLGERSFSILTPGIALVAIDGVDYLRTYSIFPHPNALAGYLGVSVFLLLNLGISRRKYFPVFLILIFTCFVLTFSLSSVIGLVVCLLLWMVREKKDFFAKAVSGVFFVTIVLSLLIPLISKALLTNNYVFSKNVTERLSLSVSSGQLVSDHFLIGSGLNTFIPNLQNINVNVNSPILLQPVHNIFLLSFSETGVIGLLIGSSLLYMALRKNINDKNIYLTMAIIFIAISGFFDHYWFTIQQNLLLLGVVIGTSFLRARRSSTFPK